MPQIVFSPLEETLLSLIGQRWFDADELAAMLAEDHPPDRVRQALAYLHRKALVLELDRRYGRPLYEQTRLGEQLLAEHRRAFPTITRGPLHRVTA